MATIDVALTNHPHQITIRPGILAHIGKLLPESPPATKVVVVTNPFLAERYGAILNDSLAKGNDLEVHIIVINDGEAQKHAATLIEVWESLATIGISRVDWIMAFGGGVIGDLVGFAGATFNRGIRVIQVPTTLLAMVDSAIGGKTAINLPQGKNLVGAFHQPAAIMMDPKVLVSLGRRERLAGFGEVTKYPMIVPSPLLDLLTHYASALTASTWDEEDRTLMRVVEEIITLSAQIKVDHIVADPYEYGIRTHLNYGHTIGHVIEQRCGYGTWHHGEAVGLGMLVAARLGALLELCDETVYTTTLELLTSLNLPTSLGTSYSQVANPESLWQVLGRDKKNQPGRIRMVLPTEVGQVRVFDNPDRDAILEALTVLA